MILNQPIYFTLGETEGKREEVFREGTWSKSTGPWGVVRRQPATLGSCAKRPEHLRCGLAGFTRGDHTFGISESIIILGTEKKRLYSIMSVFIFTCLYIIGRLLFVIDKELPYILGV